MTIMNNIEWDAFLAESKKSGVLIERVIKSFYRRLLRRDSIAVDIGAHVGYHTLGLAEKLSDGFVIACEANPKTYLLLVGAIYESKATGRIVPIHAAIQDDDGRSNVDFHFSESHPGRSGLEKTWHGLDYRSCSVVARTIDSIVFNAKLPRVDFIKCDVEGTEFQVFKGARRVLAEFQPVVVAEHSKASADGFAEDWLKYFDDLAYMAVFPNGAVVSIENFNDYWYVFLIPKARYSEVDEILTDTMVNWRRLV